jgi:hypothetical protein
LINCNDKQEVNKLLENTFAKEELKKHLGSRYGQVEQVIINDELQTNILAKIGMI